jgi:hypothetical protein
MLDRVLFSTAHAVILISLDNALNRLIMLVHKALVEMHDPRCSGPPGRSCVKAALMIASQGRQKDAALRQEVNNRPQRDIDALSRDRHMLCLHTGLVGMPHLSCASQVKLHLAPRISGQPLRLISDRPSHLIDRCMDPVQLNLDVSIWGFLAIHHMVHACHENREY